MKATQFGRLESFYTNCLKDTEVRRKWVLDHEITIFSKDTHYLDQLLAKG